LSLRKLAVAASLTAVAALMAPGAALADDGSTTFVSALKSPAVVDGKRYSAKQVQKRFADTQLFFVLGSREEADGAVAAFTTRDGRNAYMRKTETKRDRATATASWNPWQSIFYSDWFLEGASIAVNNNSANGDLSQHCMSGWVFGCFTTWDNQISSAKTGASRATLYDRPFLSTQGSSVTIPSMDSVEVWRFFDNVTSSIWVNP
jgi:hypothetical protein